MSGADSEILKYFAAIGLLLVGGFIKYLYDRLAVERGWARDDKRDQAARIDRVDQIARDSIARVERELSDKLNSHAHLLTRLQEQVCHLPTAEDIEEVRAAVARVDAGLSAVTAKVDGTSEMVRTIRDHILQGDRK